MSNRRRARHTFLMDQYAAASEELHHRVTTQLPHADTGHISDHLQRRLVAAFDTATLDPARCCPHVTPRQPAAYVLDLWRGLLSCGRCRHPDQFRRLAGDEEHRCDQCHRLMTEDEMQVVVIRVEMIVSTAVVCPGCRDDLTHRVRS